MIYPVVDKLDLIDPLSGDFLLCIMYHGDPVALLCQSMAQMYDNSHINPLPHMPI